MRYILLTIAAFIGLIFASCISDDISTSPSHTLTFSTDTLSFDTVFTDIGTPTARLLVYNRADKGISISHIAFRNPDGYFQINVDGQSGKSFQDVEIRANDSIYIFVECFIPEDSGNEPRLVEDELQFVTNGVEQKVLVEAWGQNVTRLRDVRISEDMRLTAERPYVVFDSLIVERGATLSIDPGAKVLFHDKASLTVRGTLDARGEPGKIIDLRGDRLDNVLPDVGYDILAGQWEGVSIAPESFGNRLEYVDMRSTKSGLRVDSCADLSRDKLTMVNSWLHNSQGRAFESKYAKVDAYGCVFSEAAEAVVALYGGQHRFVQCTLANNYLFAAITEPLLSLYHLLPTEPEQGAESLPLMQASFENSIIYGLASDINTGDLSGSQVFLRYVMMRANGTDDDNFIHCFWDCDPFFYTVREDYYFNYRLKPDSPAIGVGNPAFLSPICETDMDGNRRNSSAPTLGAYVFTEPKDDKN